MCVNIHFVWCGDVSDIDRGELGVTFDVASMRGELWVLHSAFPVLAVQSRRVLTGYSGSSDSLGCPNSIGSLLLSEAQSWGV